MDKYCNKCSLVKPIEEFPKGRNSCSVCRNIFLQEYRVTNKEKAREYNSLWYRENIHWINEYRKSYKIENKEKIQTSAKRYYELNRIEKISYAINWAKTNSERKKELARLWDKNNRNKRNAKSAKRRASKLERTVAWVNEFFISEIYHLAKIRTEITGIRWHVDHIVPLNSKFVSGLHCESNLRVIQAPENISKSNKYWPDMWPKENN